MLLMFAEIAKGRLERVYFKDPGSVLYFSSYPSTINIWTLSVAGYSLQKKDLMILKG